MQPYFLWSLYLCLCLQLGVGVCQLQNATVNLKQKSYQNDNLQALKLNTVNGFTVSAPPKDALNKRDVNTVDLSGSATAKSYDPPPEFYRGPGSIAGNPSYNNRDSVTSGFISKPVTITELTGHAGSTSGDKLSDEYNKWQVNRNSYGSYLGPQDRISVGHYGAAAPSAHSGNTLNYGSSAHGSYAYDARPNDYPQHSSPHYQQQPTGPHYGGYYGSSSAEHIPFDVYGSKGGGHYAGGGGEYSYTYPNEHGHEPAAHKAPGDISHKVLLAKSFLIPLASAAVLGIAAALVSNPLLLQLGTVSGFGPTVLGKRKRRDVGHVQQLSVDKQKPQLQKAFRGYAPKNA